MDGNEDIRCRSDKQPAQQCPGAQEGPSRTITCTVRFETTTAQLCVLFDSPAAWKWSVGLLNGATFETGISTSAIAAKLAAQSSFEGRLRRAGLERWAAVPYRWGS